MKLLPCILVELEIKFFLAVDLFEAFQLFGLHAVFYILQESLVDLHSRGWLSLLCQTSP